MTSKLSTRSISGLKRAAQNGDSTRDQLESVLNRLKRLKNPTTETEYLCFFRCCYTSKTIPYVKRIHTHLAFHGLDLTGFLIENLLSTLCKCGAMKDALQIFHRLPSITVFTWTAIISGYVDSDLPKDAIHVYESMVQEAVEPDAHTFVSLFKACGMVPDIALGRDLHLQAASKGFISQVFVCNTLISMYGKCGAIDDAETVFAEMLEHDIVSYNAMMSAYAEQGCSVKALLLYRQMHADGTMLPDSQSFMFALQAVQNYAAEENTYFTNTISPRIVSLEIGLALHADAYKRGCSLNNFVGNTLVRFYGSYGTLNEAFNAFHGLSNPDIVSWTGILCALFEQGQPEMALQLYIKLPQEEMNSNHQTYLIALQSCGSLAEKEEAIMIEEELIKPMSLEIGRALHNDVQSGGLDASLFVGNALVSMFAKCGSLQYAECVFLEMSNHDVVSWNAMMSAYVEHGKAEKALQLFRQILEQNVHPNRQTYMSIFQACNALLDVDDFHALDGGGNKTVSYEIGRALHASILKSGLTSDVFVGTALVRMYGKCGSITEAENAYGDILYKDVVACTALLSTYIDQGEDEKALLLFDWMQKKNMVLDDVTLVCILLVCRNTGRVEMCRQVYFTLISCSLESNPLLGSTLVHVFGSFASMDDTKPIFNTLVFPDVAAWNACINGYATLGDYNTTLQMYEEMCIEAYEPDRLTYASVLSVCSHTGLIKTGLHIFESMYREHNMIHDTAHHVLIIDLFGRAGDLDRAQKFLSATPKQKQADLATWSCLLGSCRMHGNVQLAQFAFEHLMNMQCDDPATYILMSNTCIEHLTD